MMNDENRLFESDDDLLPAHFETLMKTGLVTAPDSFTASVLRHQVVQPVRFRLRFQLLQLCRWGAMVLGGLVAASEALAFLFGFWTAGVAL